MTRVPGMSDEIWRRAVTSRAVRKATEARARQIAQRAQALADQDGAEVNISVATGTRPGGRSYAYVQTDRADLEHGTSDKKRRAYLRRAASGG